ncbi:cardiolipin synthase [Brevibacillus fluminis]|uniref:cardiolipin synthase n=1 Tax=Brevibacillus fluminis TaxID=511487 RepID=UPI003F8A71BA
MEILSKLYIVLLVVNIMFALSIIFLERRNIAATWSWLMVLVFFPIAGFFLYIFLGQNLRKRKIYRIKRQEIAMVSRQVEEQATQLSHARLGCHDPSVYEYENLIYMHLTTNYSLLSTDNKVDIFTDGNDKFAQLLQDIEAAQDHIHMLYYIVRDDELGRRILNALTKKAREGVAVRFLYDDIGSSHLSRHFFDELRKAGGEAVPFFPSKIPYINPRINYRNHRKIVVIDGKVGYVGGFNIGNEYLGLDPYLGYWRDTHLRLSGGAVLHLQAPFFLDWNLATGEGVAYDERYFPKVEGGGKTAIQIVTSGPNSKWHHIRDGYVKMIHSAKESVLLQSPYFIPDDSLLNAMKIAALSGVDVKLMLPRKADHKFTRWASHSYVGELLESGIKCYFYEKGFLHAKTIVVDGKIASVGTANLDIRSFKLNFEINAFVYDTETACKLVHIFNEDLKECSEETLAEYIRRSRFARFKESIARLVSPIL